ncbi:MAG: hypothetical protein NUV91_07020 [Candidatus Omnitrophica bacterium]|nr:hypothetical protein [Candidatus Omnitrophota bacterium]
MSRNNLNRIDYGDRGASGSFTIDVIGEREEGIVFVKFVDQDYFQFTIENFELNVGDRIHREKVQQDHFQGGKLESWTGNGKKSIDFSR